jgi:hypothetical protein
VRNCNCSELENGFYSCAGARAGASSVDLRTKLPVDPEEAMASTLCCALVKVFRWSQ